MKNEGPPAIIEKPADDDDDEEVSSNKKSFRSRREVRGGNFLSPMMKKNEQSDESNGQKLSERFAEDLRNVFPNLVAKEENPSESEPLPEDYEVVDAYSSTAYEESHEYPLHTVDTTHGELPMAHQGQPSESTPDFSKRTGRLTESESAKASEVSGSPELHPELPEFSSEEINEPNNDAAPYEAAEVPASVEDHEKPPEIPSMDLPPTPPTPPIETTPDFGSNLPPIPPRAVSNGGRPNFEQPTSIPSPRVEQAPTPSRRGDLGPIALVAAIAVDIMSRGRDRRNRRRQEKKNRQLEKMIKEKNNKQVYIESIHDKASRPGAEIVSPPTIITKEQQQMPKIIARQPEAIAIAQQQREKLQMPPSPRASEQNMFEKQPKPSPSPEGRMASDGPILREQQHSTTIVEESRASRVEQSHTAASEKITETINEKQTEKLIEKQLAEEQQTVSETISDRRHEVKGGYSGETLAETLGSIGSKKTPDSQPVTHISNVLADKHFSVTQKPDNFSKELGQKKDLNKMYVQTGFVAAIIIVIGVVLIISLR